MDILLVIVNVLIFLILAPLYEGIVRKLTAKVQSRQGPPIVQPYYDLIKLLGKETLTPGNAAFSVAPLMAFASILAAIAFMPLGLVRNALSGYADIITVIYLLTAGGVAVILGALSSRNTFALIGASREMVTMIMVEPVLAMTLILGAVRAGSLGIDQSVLSTGTAGYSASVAVMLAVYLMALQAFVAKQPFDISEAEVEIVEGPFIEYSGPNYALFKYYMMLKQMFYAYLFVAVFAQAPATGWYAADIAIQLAETALVFVLIAVLGSTNPRLRIDQAVKYYAVLIFVSLCAVGLSVKGL